MAVDGGPTLRARPPRRDPAMILPELRSAREHRCVADLPRRKHWRHRRLITEHAFDKLRLLDCVFAEFEIALETAQIIEERDLGGQLLKQVVLVVDWTRPLHAIVVVDVLRDEERIVTVYEPDPDRWSDDYRRRR